MAKTTSEGTPKKAASETTSERATLGYSMKMEPDLLQFLDNEAPAMGHSTVAGVLRELGKSVRTIFALPPSMAERIRQDMKDKGYDFFTYMRELLLYRYEELQKQDAKKR